MGTTKNNDVIIVGAGPVGLTLAIDLGKRGIRVTLIERNEQPLYRPKMERSNARSMEIFRRLGLAESIRAASKIHDIPMDVFLLTGWSRPPLLHLEYPSSDIFRENIAACDDGSLPLEPYQIISQYTLEPLLMDVIKDMPNITVHTGCELESFTQTDSYVEAKVKGLSATNATLQAAYMVGCDGGVSTVRKGLGIKLEGEGRIAQQHQVFFHSEQLFAALPVGKGRHYYLLPDIVLVVQDDLKHFMINVMNPIDGDAEEFLRRRLDLDVDIDVISVASWNMNLLVAEKYQQDRVFLAGDSVHLVIPNGGLGMNTGIGDATDLAWKLAGTLQGWGGEGLLASYEAERRQVGLFNVHASKTATGGMLSWMKACTADICEDSPAGDKNRLEVGALAAVGQRTTHEMSGVELGYQYKNSPLILTEAEDNDEPQFIKYHPNARPGSRLPHMWLEDGRAIQDLIGDGYTMLVLNADDAKLVSAPLVDAMFEIGAPLQVIALNEIKLRNIYESNYLILRPDMHVAWRGDSLHSDAKLLAKQITGHIKTK